MNESLYRIRYFNDDYKWLVEKLWKDNSFYFVVNRFDTEQEAKEHVEYRQIKKE
jgi:hypothetical protein